MGVDSFLDLYFKFEIVLIAVYYSGDVNQTACQNIYNNCLNPTNELTSPGPVACQSIYQNCLSDDARLIRIYYALIVIGSIGAALLVSLIIAYFWVQKTSKQEIDRIMQICENHQPLITSTNINPKYSIALRFQQSDWTIFGHVSIDLVILQKRISIKEKGNFRIADLSIIGEKDEVELVNYQPLETNQGEFISFGTNVGTHNSVGM